MPRLLFVTACLLLTASIQAQESDTTYWTKGGVGTFTFSQVSLNNWAAGGDNSVSLNGYFNVFANYAKGNSVWQNDLILGYGLIKQGSGDLEKTDDKINLVTQYGIKLKGDKLYWSSLLDFKSQFAEGLNAEGEVISKFMAPGYLMVATGLDWKPSDKFSLTYAPLSGKFTFVNDLTLADQGAFGVDAGKKSRAELGSFLKAQFKDELVENVTLDTRIELFANYLDNFGNIDVNLENAFVMKVNDFLTVNWIIQLLYDDDINIEEYNDDDVLIGVGPRTQFKSVFGVGLSYNFGAKKE